MFELIYHSVANENLQESDITDILNVARDFNSKNDITGCLLYHNNRFIQILEGAEEIVRQLYAAIEDDPRHNTVILVNVGEKTERMFDGWSMALHKLGKGESAQLDKFLFVNNFKLFSDLVEKSSDAVRLFFQLSKQLLKD